ncbi:MAG: hypothetical protein K8963_11565 [Proteobacteria bacterium]|nr:hypothetical protein [Pseudomonadota bacterium]
MTNENQMAGSQQQTDQPQRKGLVPAVVNYVVRHWRGELSLAVSFWVNGILIGIVAIVMHELLGLVLRVNFLSPQTPDVLSMNLGVAFALFLYETLLLLPLMIWQTLGIWRAAGRHIATTERRFFATITKLICLPSFLVIGIVFIFVIVGTYEYIADPPAFLERIEGIEPSDSL